MCVRGGGWGGVQLCHHNAVLFSLCLFPQHAKELACVEEILWRLVWDGCKNLGLQGAPHPPLNPDLLSSWHFLGTSFVQLTYRMCIWVTHKGQMWQNVGSGKRLFTQGEVGCEHRCSGRGYMIEVEGEGDLRGAWEEQHTPLRVLILAFSLQRSGFLSYPPCKGRGNSFDSFNPENGIWIRRDVNRGETLPSETAQIPKFRAVDRLSITRLLIFLCLTLSGGLAASTFTSWHYDMTEWFLGGEKLSVESQWKLTSTPVLFFFFFLLSPVMAF